MAKTSSIKDLIPRNLISGETLFKNILFVIFLSFLAVFYIANRNYAERNARDFRLLQKETLELKQYHLTLQSELMFKSQRSKWRIIFGFA